MLLMLVALLSGLLSLSPPQVCASDVGVLYEMMLERALGLRLKICAICTHECPNHSVRDIRKAWANEELKYLGLIDIIVRGLDSAKEDRYNGAPIPATDCNDVCTSILKGHLVSTSRGFLADPDGFTQDLDDDYRTEVLADAEIAFQRFLKYLQSQESILKCDNDCDKLLQEDDDEEDEE